jgi:TolB-like protein/Tfp pilus assembly protein PilF
MAWLVMQVADVVLSHITAPSWIFQVLMLFLAIGLPFAVFFAWAFELTPEGLKRESEVDRTQSITPQTGKKLNLMITVVLLLALGYFAVDKFMLSSTREQAAIESAVNQAASQAVTDKAADAASDKSIAVLPFVNMSSDAEQEYFSDGLSEELLNLLAKIPELKVASRSSAFQFKGEKIDLVYVAHKLKVAYVLEGSVRKAGNQLRITAQLIKAEDGYHLWSETYNRSLDNIFAIQDEISAAVVDALKIELLGAAPKAKVVNPEAYALVLKARYLYAKWGKENFAAALEAYQQALAIDPDYAEAWAGLSVTYLSQTQSGYLEGKEGLVLARDAVDKAVALNPNLATAWARLSLIQSVFEWDWTGAGNSVQKALGMSPNDVQVLSAAGNLANLLGHLDEALAYYQRVLADDPLNMINLYNAADMLHRQGQLEEAERAYRKLLDLNPEDWGSHTQVAIIMLQQNRAQDAWNELELEVDPQQQEYGRILALFSLGKDEEARQRLDQFIEKNQSWGAFPIATIYAWNQDADTAFKWLDRAYEQRDGLMCSVLKEPLFAKLHDDPRWLELVDKMGLPH